MYKFSRKNKQTNQKNPVHQCYDLNTAHFLRVIIFLIVTVMFLIYLQYYNPVQKPKTSNHTAIPYTFSVFFAYLKNKLQYLILNK